MNILTNALKLIGLDNTDIELYFLFLNQTDFSVTKLSTKLGISRVTVYKSLNKLVSLELINKSTNNKQKYTLSNPKQIEKLLRIKQFEYNNIADDTAEQIDKLELDYLGLTNDKIIKVYTGRNELTKFIVQNMKFDSGWIDIFGGADFFELVDFEIWKKWILTMADKNIKVRLITDSKNFRIKQLLTNSNLNNFYTKQTKTNFEYSGSYSLSQNIILIWDTVNPKVIVIEDSNIVNVFRNQFDLAWESMR